MIVSKFVNITLIIPINIMSKMIDFNYYNLFFIVELNYDEAI